MKRSQTITFWIVMLLIIVVMYQMSRLNNNKIQQIGFSDFEELYRRGEISKVLIDYKDLTVTAANGQMYAVYLPFEPDSEFIAKLSEYKVNVISKKPSTFMGLLKYALYWINQQRIRLI